MPAPSQAPSLPSAANDNQSRPSVEECQQLLADAKPGQSFAGKKLLGLNLAGMNLQRMNFDGADLSGCNLTDARMSGASLVGATLHRATLMGAELLGADLTRCDLTEAKAQNAGLGRTRLIEARLFGASLEHATLTEADLSGADFRAAQLQQARLKGARLRGTSFQRADLQHADLEGTTLANANFLEADLRRARLRNAREFNTATFIHADIRDVDFSGAYLLRRQIHDENYLFEFRSQGRLGAALYWLWWATSDCGRSVGRWTVWTAVVWLAFGGIYGFVDIDYGDHPTQLSPYYFSLVTLTTLGYGDVLPQSASAQLVVMAEVVLGYLMLGGLLSIVAAKMGRRAD